MEDHFVKKIFLKTYLTWPSHRYLFDEVIYHLIFNQLCGYGKVIFNEVNDSQ